MDSGDEAMDSGDASWVPTYWRISWNFYVLRCWRSEESCALLRGQHLTFVKEADAAAAAQRFGWDLRLWDSTVRIRFLLSSTIFYPKSDTHIFSISQWYLLYTKDDIKTKAVCQTKRPKFGPKAEVRQFLVVFLISFDGFFSLSIRSLPEATLVQHRAEATTTSTGRPGTATSRRCGTSSVSIRRKCTRKTSCLAATSKNGWIATPAVVGGRCQKKSNILKFGFNRNLDFSMLVYVWIWTSRLLMTN